MKLRVRYPLPEHKVNNAIAYGWLDFRRALARRWERTALVVYEWLWP